MRTKPEDRAHTAFLHPRPVELAGKHLQDHLLVLAAAPIMYRFGQVKLLKKYSEHKIVFSFHLFIRKQPLHDLLILIFYNILGTGSHKIRETFC